MASELHVLMFPHFLYPLLQIAVTASIYMTVAIATERYIAVHYPIDYSQAINSPEACKRRLLKYVIPVILLSTLLNIPKFLESEVHYDDYEILDTHFSIGHNNTLLYDETNLTNYYGNQFKSQNPSITVTGLRKNAYYVIYYTQWTSLGFKAIIP